MKLRISILLNVVLLLLVGILALYPKNTLTKDREISCVVNQIRKRDSGGFNVGIICNNDEYNIAIWERTRVSGENKESKLRVQPFDNRSYFIYEHYQVISEEEWRITLELDGYSPVDIVLPLTE